MWFTISYKKMIQTGGQRCSRGELQWLTCWDFNYKKIYGQSTATSTGWSQELLILRLPLCPSPMLTRLLAHMPHYCFSASYFFTHLSPYSLCLSGIVVHQASSPSAFLSPWLAVVFEWCAADGKCWVMTDGYDKQMVLLVVFNQTNSVSCEAGALSCQSNIK